MIRTILFIFIIFNINLFAEWEFLGHNQTRSELVGSDFNNKTYAPIFTSMKTRLQVSNTIQNVTFFAQIQDSRLWGQTGASVANLGNFDLHQGYITMNNILGNVNVQLGRFEISYGTQRFLGALGWHFVGRSFDGARLNFDLGKSNLELFGVVNREDNIYKASPQLNIDPVVPSTAQTLYGAWYQNRSFSNNKFDAFFYWDIDHSPGIDLSRMNIGGTWWGDFGIVNTTVEGAYQFGSSNGTDISAYLLAAIVDINIRRNTISVGADLISGTEAGSSEINSFQANYGTNHKFYGWMDYFLNIPAHSGGLGLNDIQVKYKRKIREKLIAGLNFHHFMSNVPDAEDNNTWGQEFDLYLTYNFSQSLKITWGGSVFLPDQLMQNRWNGNSDPAFWSFLMFTANLK